MKYCRKNWSKETIPPNLHMLEDHEVGFIVNWSSPGHAVYGQHPFIKYPGYRKEHAAQCN